MHGVQAPLAHFSEVFWIQQAWEAQGGVLVSLLEDSGVGYITFLITG